MDANGAVALSTTVDHHDVVNLIYGLIFGLSIAIVTTDCVRFQSSTL